jgi:hypothetical protein
LGTIAFECLASYVPKYSRKKGDRLISKDKETKKQRLIEINNKRNSMLSESIIEEIATELSPG